jgi:hypothetical protein
MQIETARYPLARNPYADFAIPNGWSGFAAVAHGSGLEVRAKNSGERVMKVLSSRARACREDDDYFAKEEILGKRGRIETRIR